MANLSNINNKFIVTDGGQALVNQTVAGFNPDADDLIVGNLSGNTGITIASGSSAGNYGSIYFADGAGSSTPSKAGFIRYEQNTSEMTIGINAVPKIAIDIGGNTTITTTSNQGGLTVTSATDNTVVGINNTATGGQAWRLQSTGGSSGLGAGKLFLKVGGTETAGNLISFITDGSGANIKMGIGEDSPDATLHIKHNSDISSDFLIIEDSDSTAGSVVPKIVFRSTSSTIGGIRGHDVRGLQLGGGANIQDLNINPSGNVGIGATSPDQKLVVQADWNGSLSNNQQLQIQGDTDTTLQLRLGYDTTNDYAEIAALKSGTGYKNIILNRGGANIGIGTASTEGKLTISYTAAELPTSGTTSNSAIQVISSLNNQLNLGLNTVSGDYGAYIQASDNNLAVPYPLNLQPNGGLAYFGGQVAIGDSTPNSGGKLDVVGGLISNGYNSNGRSTFDGSTNSDLTITVNQSQANVQPRIWFEGSNGGATPTTYAKMDVDGFYPPNGIFLGGTAAANKLDDYDEGTFTATTNNDGVGIQVTANYRKIGQLVTYTVYIPSWSPTVAGTAVIAGFPFAAITTNGYGVGNVTHSTGVLNCSGGYHDGTNWNGTQNNSTGRSFWVVASARSIMVTGFYYTS